MIIICFDIRNDKRLRRIAKALENVGQRVQRSIFECHLSPEELATLQSKIEAIMDKDEDEVRYYSLCAKDVGSIKIDGTGTVSKDPDFHLL